MTATIIHADQAQSTGMKRSEASKAAVQIVRRLLSRTYGDVDRIVTFDVTPSGKLSTVFWSGQQLIAMTINNGAVEYRLVGLTDPERSLIEDDPKVDSAERSDRGFNQKPKQCVVGLNCGMTCISDIKTCKLSLKSVASQSEQKVLRQAGAVLAAGAQSSQSKYEGRNLRDLQKEARERGVYRANHQRKEELIQTLEAIDKDPNSQERLRRTLEKRNQARKEVDRRLGTPWKVWKEFERLSRLTGAAPLKSSLLMASLLGGFALQQYEEIKKRYQSNFDTSAEIAAQRADGMGTEAVRKKQIIFTVGGFASTGSTGDAIKDALLNDSLDDSGFFGKQHIINVNHTDYDISYDGRSKKDSTGRYNPVYLGTLLKEGAGKFIRNARRGQNSASVDLAAQLYAYGRDYPDKPLYILAHDAGGNITREAVEVLSRMEGSGGLTGKSILGRVKVVALGTNDWGLANSKNVWGIAKDQAGFQTLTGVGDPFSNLPTRNADWVNGLSGHEVEDYLSNPFARKRIREAFGEQRPARPERRAQEKQRAERKKQDLSMVLPPLNPFDKEDPRNDPDFNRLSDMERGKRILSYRAKLEKAQAAIRASQLNPRNSPREEG